MRILRAFLLLVVLFAVSAGAEEAPAQSEADARLAQTVSEGINLAVAHKYGEAIERFDTVIASYEDRFRGSDDILRCARWLGESMFYLLDAASKEPGKKVIGLSPTWADAYYLKAYVLVHIGQFAEAKPWLDKAIVLSPSNSLYLSELGGIFQREKNWPMALQSFQSAEQAAELSPQESKKTELAKAWRGIAYVFVEQGRIEEAESLYRKCLELDKDDTRAANELRYIEKMRTRQGVK